MDEILSLLSLVFPLGFFLLLFLFFTKIMGTIFGGTTAMERLLKGKVMREFGMVETRKRGLATLTTTAYEVERGGERILVLRKDARAVLGASVSFEELSPAARTKLRAMIEVMDGAPSAPSEAYLLGLITA